jgi:DNA invertase Pin-like site-specific DNA recombinase
MNVRTLRCAIYTRKSSEEGLDQDFTSLDAQREACAAYIQSQRHEGWMPVSTRYDDGGFSGGTLERPALRTLLADIDAGKIDLIVVYKIDRLTRSLADFAKIVERLDARSASFVSVTQSFNTTTSMGRLTLNVLLSFAQFEREVTGERIRDKIAASKKKGMWMGGFVPLGYEVVDRQLVIQTEEAAEVRRVFELYCTHKNLADVQRILAADGVVKKRRPNAKGRTQGGMRYSSGALHYLLRNPLYRGYVRHKGTVYPGQHEAIVSEAVWREAQAIGEGRKAQVVRRVRDQHPLLGLLTDEHGRRYQASHSSKGGKRYRYYVSRKSESNPDHVQTRVPAAELESRVAERVRSFLTSPGALLDAIANPNDEASARKRLIEHGRALADGSTSLAARPLLQQVCLHESTIEITLDRSATRATLGLKPDVSGEHDEVRLSIAARLHRTGHELRLVIDNEHGTSMRPDAKLIRLVAKGRRWYEELVSGQTASLRSIAKREGVGDTYVSRVLHAALLAPDIVERILNGTQPITLTVDALRTSPPLDWDDQRRLFGIASK